MSSAYVENAVSIGLMKYLSSHTGMVESLIE